MLNKIVEAGKGKRTPRHHAAQVEEAVPVGGRRRLAVGRQAPLLAGRRRISHGQRKERIPVVPHRRPYDLRRRIRLHAALLGRLEDATGPRGGHRRPRRTAGRQRSSRGAQAGRRTAAARDARDDGRRRRDHVADDERHAARDLQHGLRDVPALAVVPVLPRGLEGRAAGVRHPDRVRLRRRRAGGRAEVARRPYKKRDERPVPDTLHPALQWCEGRGDGGGEGRLQVFQQTLPRARRADGTDRPGEGRRGGSQGQGDDEPPRRRDNTLRSGHAAAAPDNRRFLRRAVHADRAQEEEDIQRAKKPRGQAPPPVRADLRARDAVAQVRPGRHRREGQSRADRRPAHRRDVLPRRASLPSSGVRHARDSRDVVGLRPPGAQAVPPPPRRDVRLLHRGRSPQSAAHDDRQPHGVVRRVGGGGWPLVNSIPSEEVCAFAQHPDNEKYPVPNVMHYCQRYAVDKYFWGKRKTPHDIFTCDHPLLVDVPSDLGSGNYLRVYPNSKPNAKPREIDAKREKQDAFMLCGLTAATNDAMIHFKDRHCGDAGGGERGRTYSMWSGKATQPEEKPKGPDGQFSLDWGRDEGRDEKCLDRAKRGRESQSWLVSFNLPVHIATPPFPALYCRRSPTYMGASLKECKRFLSQGAESSVYKGTTWKGRQTEGDK
ncbi:hypothetical protein THAOC_05932 [Thalassiosira oceanica]|uniref:Uncharacterized protein n=1 Tax=Thalassiosira oceanica TaxID=159749 RepID=K0TMA3_THAOC|nr:hypothetical protein THAOC_05932 [Thalassiosira oceanica]|eukprot:EJK72532.1 hypothetical protein THAOC_05932 [Thalassiosira oceanica]